MAIDVLDKLRKGYVDEGEDRGIIRGTEAAEVVTDVIFEPEAGVVIVEKRDENGDPQTLTFAVTPGVAPDVSGESLTLGDAATKNVGTSEGDVVGIGPGDKIDTSLLPVAPTLGTAASKDAGTGVGDVVEVGADGKIASSLFDTTDIDFADIPADTIQTSMLADGAVTEDKLATAVQTKLNERATAPASDPISVDTGDLVNGAVTNPKIADSTIAEGKLAPAVVTKLNARIATTGQTQAQVDARIALKVEDFAETDKNTTIPTAKITDNAITEDKLADTAVAEGKLKDNAVAEAKLSAAVRAKLNAVGTGGGLSADAVNTRIAAEVEDFALEDETATVPLTRFQDGLLTGAKLANKTIEAGKIADSTITTTQIADGTIAEGDLATALAAKINATKTITGPYAQVLSTPNLDLDDYTTDDVYVIENTVGIQNVPNNFPISDFTNRSAYLLATGNRQYIIYINNPSLRYTRQDQGGGRWSAWQRVQDTGGGGGGTTQCLYIENNRDTGNFPLHADNLPADGECKVQFVESGPSFDYDTLPATSKELFPHGLEEQVEVKDYSYANSEISTADPVPISSDTTHVYSLAGSGTDQYLYAHKLSDGSLDTTKTFRVGNNPANGDVRAIVPLTPTTYGLVRLQSTGGPGVRGMTVYNLTYEVRASDPRIVSTVTNSNALSLRSPAVDATADSNYLYIAADDRLYIFALATLTLIRNRPLPSGVGITGLALSPDDRYLWLHSVVSSGVAPSIARALAYDKSALIAGRFVRRPAADVHIDARYDSIQGIMLNTVAKEGSSRLVFLASASGGFPTGAPGVANTYIVDTESEDGGAATHEVRARTILRRNGNVLSVSYTDQNTGRRYTAEGMLPITSLSWTEDIENLPKTAYDPTISLSNQLVTPQTVDSLESAGRYGQERLLRVSLPAAQSDYEAGKTLLGWEQVTLPPQRTSKTVDEKNFPNRADVGNAARIAIGHAYAGNPILTSGGVCFARVGAGSTPGYYRILDVVFFETEVRRATWSGPTGGFYNANSDLSYYQPFIYDGTGWRHKWIYPVSQKVYEDAFKSVTPTPGPPESRVRLTSETFAIQDLNVNALDINFSGHSAQQRQEFWTEAIRRGALKCTITWNGVYTNTFSNHATQRAQAIANHTFTTTNFPKATSDIPVGSRELIFTDTLAIPNLVRTAGGDSVTTSTTWTKLDFAVVIPFTASGGLTLGSDVPVELSTTLNLNGILSSVVVEFEAVHA